MIMIWNKRLKEHGYNLTSADRKKEKKAKQIFTKTHKTEILKLRAYCLRIL